VKTHPIFSDEDEDLNDRSWRTDRCGYARTTINRKPEKPVTVFAHHLVCERVFGRRPDWSKREVCDHINQNRLDNRRENLRITTVRTNARNRKHANADRPYATRHSSGKWQAAVWKNRRSRYLGLFETSEEATQAALKFIRENNLESAISGAK